MAKNRGSSLETLVRHASKRIRDEYRKLKEVASGAAGRIRELETELAQAREEVATAAWRRQALQSVLAGEAPGKRPDLPQEVGSRKRKTKKRIGGGSKKAEIARRWQGAYIGLLRSVKSEAERARVRKIAVQQGVPEAVKYMRGKRGLITAVPSKSGGLTSENGKKLAVQLELLKAKAAATNGKVPEAAYVALAKKHGLKEGQLVSLFARTQGKFRQNFLRRLVAGLPNGEALRKLAEIAPLYGKRRLAELQREAGL